VEANRGRQWTDDWDRLAQGLPRRRTRRLPRLRAVVPTWVYRGSSATHGRRSAPRSQQYRFPRGQPSASHTRGCLSFPDGRAGGGRAVSLTPSTSEGDVPRPRCQVERWTSAGRCGHRPRGDVGGRYDRRSADPPCDARGGWPEVSGYVGGNPLPIVHNRGRYTGR